ncbi:hypothetical protein D3C76_1265550 [compost metagenome]
MECKFVTNAASRSWDKLAALQQLSIFAAQHGIHDKTAQANTVGFQLIFLCVVVYAGFALLDNLRLPPQGQGQGQWCSEN